MADYIKCFMIIFCALWTPSFGRDFDCRLVGHPCGVKEGEQVGTVILNPHNCASMYKCIENEGNMIWDQIVCKEGYKANETGLCNEEPCEPPPRTADSICHEGDFHLNYDKCDEYDVCVSCEGGQRSWILIHCPAGQFFNEPKGICALECVLPPLPPKPETTIAPPPGSSTIAPPPGSTIAPPPGSTIAPPPGLRPPHDFKCEDHVHGTTQRRWADLNNCSQFHHCVYSRLRQRWREIHAVCPIRSHYWPQRGACSLGPCKQ